MKKKIQEVQSYFKTKLLRGEFEIVNREAYTYIVSIDGEYEFTIWMKNDPVCRKLYKSADNNFMDINLTEEESILLHNLLVSDYISFIEETLIKSKEESVKKLEIEIKKLKGDEGDN